MSPPRAVERFYDRHAATYEEKFSSPRVAPVKRREEENILAFVDRWLPSGCELLELGAGTGIFTAPFLERGHRVTAVDISRAMLERLQLRLESDGLHARLEHADVETSPDLGRHDAVAALGLLEYVRDPDGVLRWAARTVRPGGVTLWTAPTRTVVGWCYFLVSTIRMRRTIRVYSRRDLETRAQRAGLEVLALDDLEPAPPLRWPLTRMLAARRPAD